MIEDIAPQQDALRKSTLPSDLAVSAPTLDPLPCLLTGILQVGAIRLLAQSGDDIVNEDERGDIHDHPFQVKLVFCHIQGTDDQYL